MSEKINDRIAVMLSITDHKDWTIINVEEKIDTSCKQSTWRDSHRVNVANYSCKVISKRKKTTIFDQFIEKEEKKMENR